MYDTRYVITISFLSILQRVCSYPLKVFQDIIIVPESRVYWNLYIIEDFIRTSKIASLVSRNY